MKTKMNFSKKILSIILALVMVIGMLPMTAFAAAEATPLKGSGSAELISYEDGVTCYKKHENYLYKVTCTNLKSITHVRFSYSSSSSNKPLVLFITSNSFIYLYHSNSYKLKLEELPKVPGEVMYGYTDNWVIDPKKPVVTITCMAVGDPTWTWDGTSSATAVFTSQDGNAMMTVDAAITSTTQAAASCLKKDVVTYTASATANGAAYTDTKTVDGEPGPHSLEYTVAGNTLTETCANSCGHSAKATLTTPQKSYTYTGGFIMPAVLTFDENWKGKKASYTDYKDNVDVGIATVTSDPAGIIVTTTFEIKAADIAGATITFDPKGASYHGIMQKPTVLVVWNGKQLKENTDYTLLWDKSGFIDADDYTVTVTGKGNFEGTKDAVFRINPAEIQDAVVTLEKDTFIYDGQPHKPTAIVFFEGEILTEGVDYELYYVSSDRVIKHDNGKPVKFFGTGKENSDSINAGQYYAVVFGKGNFADNGKFAYAPYTIEKAIVTEPTVAEKPFSGSVQTADITDTYLYTVVKNDGGIGVHHDNYDVILELKDAANYKWSSTDDAQVTLKFVITRATNEWTVTPSLSGWTYGETAKVPVGAAKFGEVSVEYTGTANDGTTYSSITAPTKAGNYTAAFIVAETEDYTGLEASVDFTIAKADYDMSGARWNYNSAFQYDGNEHKVEVTGLPNGVAASGYTGNTATDAGSYIAKVTLSYDADNYNAPVMTDLNWKIQVNNTPAVNDSNSPTTGDNSSPWLWFALLFVFGAVGLGSILNGRKIRTANKK